MEQFLINEIHDVFVTDAKLSSHPIVQTVKNPDEITAIFDEITYEKVTIIASFNNFNGFFSQILFFHLLLSCSNFFFYFRDHL